MKYRIFAATIFFNDLFMENFNTVAKQYVDKNITRICLDKIRDRFLKGYNDTVARMANPFINSVENEQVTKISFEFSQFLSEVEQEIAENEDLNRSLTNYERDAINQIKNNFVEQIFPDKEYQGRYDYHKIRLKKSKIANMLEELLTSVYNLGKGKRELSENEKNDINDRWNQKCRNDINNAYSNGTNALALVLSYACNDNKAMDILNKGK